MQRRTILLPPDRRITAADLGLDLAPPFAYDDGGREAEGFRGKTGDCAARAISIATGLPYRQVYDGLNAEAARERRRGRGRKRSNSSARSGMHGDTVRRYMAALGWRWVPTMKIGTGCTVHLRRGELPAGRLVCLLSRHYTAVVDGVVRDTYDPSRGGDRCVYGYFQPS